MTGATTESVCRSTRLMAMEDESSANSMLRKRSGRYSRGVVSCAVRNETDSATRSHSRVAAQQYRLAGFQRSGCFQAQCHRAASFLGGDGQGSAAFEYPGQRGDLLPEFEMLSRRAGHFYGGHPAVFGN